MHPNRALVLRCMRWPFYKGPEIRCDRFSTTSRVSIWAALCLTFHSSLSSQKLPLISASPVLYCLITDRFQVYFLLYHDSSFSRNEHELAWLDQKHQVLTTNIVSHGLNRSQECGQNGGKTGKKSRECSPLKHRSWIWYRSSSEGEAEASWAPGAYDCQTCHRKTG